MEKILVGVGLVVAIVVGLIGWSVPVAKDVSSFGSTNWENLPSLKWGVGGGVRVFKGAVALKTASTTPCAIQSPAATSTLLSAGIKLAVSSSTATTWSIGIGTTAYATTTQIGTDYAVGAGKQAFINASTSPAAGAVEVIGPSKWIVFSETGGITAGDSVGTGFVPSGSCHATFEEYQSL